jgi:16S rRNA C1402 N4-methylase RsmH
MTYTYFVNKYNKLLKVINSKQNDSIVYDIGISSGQYYVYKYKRGFPNSSEIVNKELSDKQLIALLQTMTIADINA